MRGPTFYILTLVALSLIGTQVLARATSTTTPAVTTGVNPADPIANDQVLPWPWATQCPFPWDEIDGNWMVTTQETNVGPQDRFEFNIEYTAIDGTRYYEVRRYDNLGRLLARGRGFSPETVKIVRLAMIDVDDIGKSRGTNYWAFVGVYQEDRKASCSEELTTVITVRRINESSTTEDVHYVVSKQSMAVQQK